MFGRTALSFGITLLVATTGIAANAALPVERPALVTLPDGSRLELGGQVDGVSTADAVVTSERANETPLEASMLHPRSGHTATVLPDGRVFIWGGVDDQGKVVRTGEWFDPASKHFSEAQGIPLVPRTGHTATLLTDGRVLMLGGRADRLGALEEAEVWDWRSNRSELLPVQLSPAREGHRASLLADGRVLIVGPRATEATLYDPDHVRFIRAASEDASVPSAADVQLTGAIPAPDAKDVPLDALLALRFDPPLASESANEKTIALIGPHGATPARVVAAESGRLVFVTPKQDLYPASHYTVFVQGVHDRQGQSLLWHALEFDTQRFMPSPLDPRLDLREHANRADASVSIDAADTASAHTSDRSAGGKDAYRGKPFQFSKPLVTDDEVWIPSEANLGGQWRTQRPIAADIKDAINLGMSKNSQKAAWRSHRLRSGATEISGRILRLNDRPLAGVDVRVGEVRTTTDADGRFSLRGLAAGHQELVVDGSSVGKDGSSFAQFVVGVDVEAGKENPVKPIYLPKIRTQDWIEIPSPLPADLVVRNPYMPGFEVHLPAGTILRGRDGKVVRRVAVIPMPLDRTPINYPVNTPLHMTFQPGGMSVEGLTPGITKGIQFVYPNYSGEAPGRRAGFLNYDPTGKGWYTYGYGSVSADGLSVVPDADTQIYSATGFGIFFGAPPATLRGLTCGTKDGDPVDLRSGLFMHSTQGPAMSDVVPMQWRTTYRPADSQKRDFGKGTSHSYGIYLYNPGDPHTNWNEFDLVLSDCAVVRFDRVSGSPMSADYAATHTATPTSYYGATLKWINTVDGLAMTLRDGRTLYFDPFGGSLLRITDRFGRSLEITRSGGLMSRVATESGRYVDVQYDTQNRITDLADIAGRHWQYAYTPAGYLDHVTYPDTTHENFTYDATGRITDVYDRRGNRMVHNVYDSADRVTDQTLADGALYHFDYVANAQGLSTQVDVTRPNGTVRRVTFHASGYPLTDTDAFGTSLQRTVTYERDSIGFVTAFTDALNRRTELGYDSDKHVTSVTTLAGTTDALTGNFTYTPAHDLATMTDPWGRTTTFTFDARRHLKRIEDSFGRSVALTYDDLDRVTQLKDHLNRATSLGYDLYDVRTVTDPLLNSTTYFVDTLGRPAAVENALHQRTQAHYDINDRIKDVVDASGATTAFGYDAMGNLTSLTDALNRTTSWTYDARQRPLTRTDALNQSEQWTWAANERNASHTDRASRTTAAQFDDLGRLSNLLESDGRLVVPTYDLSDRLLTLNDSVSGNTAFTYTRFDQVLTETSGQGTLTYTYDAHRRLSTRLLSGQSAMSYGYDTRDRLTSLAQGAETVTFGYDRADRRTSTTLPNGIITTVTYDAADRLTALTYAGSQGDKLPFATMSYDYDAAGQLISRGGNWDTTGLPTATTAAGTVDANHRLTSFNGQTLTYDTVGSLTGDGVNQYVYNARDQLVAIKQGGVTTASFAYDAFGRRTSRTVSGVATTYRYDGENPIEETTNGAVATIMSGLGMDERYARDDTGGRRYFLTDHLGSTTALSDSGGNVTARYSYSPYGDTSMTVLQGVAPTNPYQYTGRENDGAGLYYYRARYYSPGMRRFTQEDPLGFIDGATPYAYVGGNPLSYADPMGLWRWGDPLDQGWVDFAAGFGDSMWFNIPSMIRDAAGIDGGVDKCSKAYRNGQYLDIAFEVATMGISSGLKSLAKNASRSAVRKATRPFIDEFRRAGEYIGGYIHHRNPLFGHPGGFGAYFATGGLPAWINSGSWNLVWIADGASHAATHRWLRKLEAVWGSFVNPAATGLRAADDFVGSCGCE